MAGGNLRIVEANVDELGEYLSVIESQVESEYQNSMIVFLHNIREALIEEGEVMVTDVT